MKPADVYLPAFYYFVLFLLIPQVFDVYIIIRETMYEFIQI